ncbi:MAG: outer membrane beta-barrel protein [Paludibacter sp.]|nr:outer membrane beta-barrel protein [Paludibacter sp.]
MWDEGSTSPKYLKKYKLKNMIKKISLILLFMYSISIYGKELYFKPYIRYHLPLFAQNAPNYFNIDLPINQSGYRTLSYPIENFSLAEGFKYGGTIGYAFDDVIGMELSSDYFSTDKTFMNGIINWKLNAWNIIPTFTFSMKYIKSSVIGKVGFITGITEQEKSIKPVWSTSSVSYKFNKNISVGYTISIEYNYKLSDKLAFAAECGIENTFYTPTKAELTNYFNPNYPIDYYSTYIRTIKYVSNIRNQQTYGQYDGSSTIYLPDQNSAQTRIKETLIMNSLFLGISLKYNIFKK